jgi:hypothetical protein
LALLHGLLAAVRQRAPHVATKGREGLEIAFVWGLHAAGDPVLRRPEIALGQAFSQRFKGDILKPKPLKKLGCLCVYFS